MDKNPLIGPTAHEVPNREDVSVEAKDIQEAFAKHVRTMPKLNGADTITYFSGIRAATYEEDFIIQKGKWTSNIVHAAGIQSPGITAAPAIAEDIVRYCAEELNETLIKNPTFDGKDMLSPTRQIRSHHGMNTSRKNPTMALCLPFEEISRGEIIEALHRPLQVNLSMELRGESGRYGALSSASVNLWSYKLWLKSCIYLRKSKKR